MNCRKLCFLFLLIMINGKSFSQNIKFDTLVTGSTTIIQDSRIADLGDKLMNYNISLANKLKISDGYRLMVLNTNDRAYAMQVRTNLLKSFPDHKIYMVFVSPYIKLKLGNFAEKAEAENVRKQISASKIVKGNIYLLPEKIEIKRED